MIISSLQLAQLVPYAKTDQFVAALNDCIKEFKIDTPKRFSAFIAQCAHESQGFTRLEENLNYSEEGLLKTFPKRITKEDAKFLARNPIAIANYIYANRYGNSDFKSGDGWRYRGRGLIMLTFKNNYKACGVSLGLTLVDTPDIVAQPKIACQVAGWYWWTHNCNALADRDDFGKITQIINGGNTGLSDRLRYWETAKEVFV